MRKLLLFTIACLLVFSLVLTNVVGKRTTGLVFRTLLLRGGKKPSGSSKRSSGGDKRGKPTTNRKNAGKPYKSSKYDSKKGRKNGKMELVPWAGQVAKQLNIRGKLEDLAKRGQSAYKDAYRRAKVLKSSAFEGMLLKATWPANDPVPQDILTEIIKYSIPAFKYAQAESEDDPYRMTLHKLWTKICEKDWRTVVKSFFILHCISRDCEPDASAEFGSAVREMSKVRNPKKPDHKYFDLDLVLDLDANSAVYEDFVGAYATYVIARFKAFSGRFEELSELGPKTSEKQAVAMLKKAQLLISNALKCTVSGKSHANMVTGPAVRQVSNDLRDLWKLFSQKLAKFLEASSGHKEPKANSKDIAALLQFEKDNKQSVQSFLSKASKTFAPLRIKISAELEGTPLATEKLDARISELTALSGGFTMDANDVAMGVDERSKGRKKAKSNYEDEEEEEEDEEEEEEDEEEEDDDDDDEEEEGDEDEEDESEDGNDDETENEEESKKDDDEDVKDVEDVDEDEEGDEEEPSQSSEDSSDAGNDDDVEEANDDEKNESDGDNEDETESNETDADDSAEDNTDDEVDDAEEAGDADQKEEEEDEEGEEEEEEEEVEEEEEEGEEGQEEEHADDNDDGDETNDNDDDDEEEEEEEEEEDEE